jgi:hypothetical protein
MSKVETILPFSHHAVDVDVRATFSNHAESLSRPLQLSSIRDCPKPSSILYPSTMIASVNESNNFTMAHDRQVEEKMNSALLTYVTRGAGMWRR